MRWDGDRILRDSHATFAALAANRGATQPGHAPIDGWITPSQVAEYVFCPEAHRLRAAEAVEETPRQAEGRRQHAALLRRYRASQRLRPLRLLLWLAMAAGLALAVVALRGS